MNFGEKLKKIREKSGYTLANFSDILEISQRTLQRIEKNETEASFSLFSKLKNIASFREFISFFYDDNEININRIDFEIIKFSIIGRISIKTKDSSLNYFQAELLLLHNILENENRILNTRNDIINLIQNFKIGLLDKLIISQKNKDNANLFILQLSDDEIEYIIKNKNEFIVIMYEFRNFVNKFFTLDKKLI